MANLTPTPSWDNVPQLETTTPALGGAGGPMNAQAQALANKFAYLEGENGSSKIGFKSTASSAVSISLRQKLSETLGVLDFGAICDGITDDYAPLQAAFSWLAGASGRCITFPAGAKCRSSQGIISTATNNIVDSAVYGNASSIIFDNSVNDALVLRVQNALWRNLNIYDLNIKASGISGHGLTMDGGSGDNSEFFYGAVLRGCSISAPTPLRLKNDFFESTIECNNLISTSTTGYGLLIDQDSGLAKNTVSSLTLYQNTTRGGKYGVYAKTPVSDVNIIGGTYLFAKQYGIYLENALGGAIICPHVEGNWDGSAVADTQAGIYVVSSGSFSVINPTAVRSGSGQSCAVRAFCAASGNVNLVGGINLDGVRFAYLSSASGGAANIIGGMSYLADANIAISEVAGGRLYAQRFIKNQRKVTSPLTFTPTKKDGVIVVPTSVDVAVATPSFTGEVGDTLEFIFEQIGSGNNTATFSSDYVVGSNTLGTGYGKRTYMKFMFINTTANGNKWVLVGYFVV